MRKMTTLIFTILISIRLFAPCERVIYIERVNPVLPYEKIWQAVCKIESSGNPLAYNPIERAYGIAQIREVRLNDYNVRFKKKVPQIALFNAKTSKSIFMAYVSKYDPNDIKGICRSWNGASSRNIYYGKITKQLNTTRL